MISPLRLFGASRLGFIRIKNEVHQLLLLGLPIVLTQLAQSSMGFVDTLIAGQYSSLDLAAVGLGSSIWLPIFLASSGILMATTPLVAHSTGRDQGQKITSILIQGVWVVAILSIISVSLIYKGDTILNLMEVDSALTDTTLSYLHAIVWGFPAMILYQLIRSYFEGLGKTRPAMYIACIGLLLNIPLNYIFVFGKLGFPEMGAAGCGLASAIVMWITLALGVYLLVKSETLKIPKVEKLIWFNPHELIQYLKLGIPIGFSILIEITMFCVIALLLAPLGTTIVAAHQITMTFTGLVFMIPLSLSIACTIRIGQQLGASKAEEAKLSVKVSMGLATVFAVLTSLMIALFSENIASLFTSETPLIVLASNLLLIAALFEISDGLQVTAAGALRGYKDTSVPLLIVFIAYWLIGLPLGYLLALTDILIPRLGAAGFWYGLVVGLSVSALLLITRLKSVARRELA